MIKGLDNVLRRINVEIKKIEGRSVGGLLESAAYILADCDKVEPLIPVDTGNLRASRFIAPPQRMIYETSVKFGFAANYSASVHEKIGASFKRPGAGAKFFEASLNRNEHKVLEIVRKNAKK